MAHPIPLHLPFVDEHDLECLRAALRPSAAGSSVRSLEHQVAELARRPYGVAAGSPGGGLEIALRALGIGPGDEVIVPALGAVEAADAVVRAHATPVFADVDPRSLGLTAAGQEDQVFDVPAVLREMALSARRAYTWSSPSVASYCGSGRKERLTPWEWPS